MLKGLPFPAAAVLEILKKQSTITVDNFVDKMVESLGIPGGTGPGLKLTIFSSEEYFVIFQ
jgi:hypothetical protein